MSTSHAWDVYAESLAPLGYGYPLWCPDTWNQKKPWEIEIGDVGWLRDGQFYPLIRTTVADAAQQPYGTLATDYVPFDISRAALGGNPDKIMQRVLHSRKIQETAFSAGLSANASPAQLDMGGSVTFKCGENKGGLLMLSPKGEETVIQSAGLIKNYLRTNHKKWEDFANDPDGLGLDLKAEEIIFVTGVTKTVDWGVVAFLSNQHEVEGSVSCNFGGVGSANISLRVTNDSAASLWNRAGPPASWRVPKLLRHLASSNAIASSTPGAILHAPPSPHTPTASPDSSPSQSIALVANSHSSSSTADPASSPPLKADQCIFFHYYKLKRRGILMIPPQFELKAAAGPDKPPRGPDDSGADSPGVLSCTALVEEEEAAEFEMMPQNGSQHFDPVNAALDYILENSDAQVAIASDLDLYTLFEHLEDWPRDVARALAELQASVDVDDAGVGILSGCAITGLMREKKAEDSSSGLAQAQEEIVGTPSMQNPKLDSSGTPTAPAISPSDPSPPRRQNPLRKIKYVAQQVWKRGRSTVSDALAPGGRISPLPPSPVERDEDLLERDRIYAKLLRNPDTYLKPSNTTLKFNSEQEDRSSKTPSQTRTGR